MFGGDLRKRVDQLEAVVVAMVGNQRTLAESLKLLVESANANSVACNANFTSIVESLEQIVERLAEDRRDDWWREPHD